MEAVEPGRRLLGYGPTRLSDTCKKKGTEIVSMKVGYTLRSETKIELNNRKLLNNFDLGFFRSFLLLIFQHTSLNAP